MSAPITVKPMEWARNQWIWFSYDFPYEIRCEGGIGYLVDYAGHTLDGKPGGPHDTFDAANTSANADHASRIMSCIEVNPNTRIVTVDQLELWSAVIEATESCLKTWNGTGSFMNVDLAMSQIRSIIEGKDQ